MDPGKEFGQLNLRVIVFLREWVYAKDAVDYGVKTILQDDIFGEHAFSHQFRQQVDILYDPGIRFFACDSLQNFSGAYCCRDGTFTGEVVLAHVSNDVLQEIETTYLLKSTDKEVEF